MIYNFKNIQQLYKIYNVQAKMIRVMRFPRCTCIILQDVDKNHIELISFNVNDDAELKKAEENHWFVIRNVKANLNSKIQKTSHKFRLIVETQTKLEKLKCITWMKNDKIYVKEQEKRRNLKQRKKQITKQTTNKMTQLSMLNFINKKK